MSCRGYPQLLVITQNDRDRAEQRARYEIDLQAGKYLGSQFKTNLIEGGAAAGTGSLALFAFANGWNPLGWGAAVATAGLIIKSAYDFKVAGEMADAARLASTLYTNCDNIQ